MQFTDRDRAMIVLGMVMSQHDKPWVRELESVLPPNGDLSRSVVEAIRSNDDKQIRAVLPMLGIDKTKTVRRGILLAAVWHASRKYIDVLCRRVSWAAESQDREEITARLREYQTAVDSVLKRWGEDA